MNSRVGVASGIGIGHRRGGLAALAGDSEVANGAGKPCRAGANASGLSRRPVLFRRGVKLSACNIRRSSVASSGPLPMVHWKRSMIGQDPARSPPLQPRRGHGWWTSLVATRRSLAIRMSCGRPGSWRAMRASVGRRRGVTAWPSLPKGQCAKSSTAWTTRAGFAARLQEE